jgi:hypothetical protein
MSRWRITRRGVATAGLVSTLRMWERSLRRLVIPPCAAAMQSIDDPARRTGRGRRVRLTTAQSRSH